MQWFFL
ncbi:hypothetical protein D030_5190A, partial [Vibrio parahaemolyticus AQ3810]